MQMAEIEQVKDMLRAARILKQRMEDKKEQLSEAKKNFLSVAHNYENSASIIPCMNQSQTEKILDIITNTQECLIREAGAYCDVYNEVLKMISSITIFNKYGHIDTEKTEICKSMMEKYYLQNKTWEEIAYETKYTWRHVHRFHSLALQCIAKKMS